MGVISFSDYYLFIALPVSTAKDKILTLRTTASVAVL
jgi:hypothetical protein